MKLLYQKLNRLRTQDLLIQKMRYRKSRHYLTSVKTVVYAGMGLCASHLFQQFADDKVLQGFDVIAIAVLVWLAFIVVLLESWHANDVAGFELIQNLLELRSQNQGLTKARPSFQMEQRK